jgi:hypothetical protein
MFSSQRIYEQPIDSSGLRSKNQFHHQLLERNANSKWTLPVLLDRVESHSRPRFAIDDVDHGRPEFPLITLARMGFALLLAVARQDTNGLQMREAPQCYKRFGAQVKSRSTVTACSWKAGTVYE